MADARGGKAVGDAAVATGFALAVVHPQAGNIGGGGFMLIRMADGKFHFLDYREKAPAAATVDMYWDKQGNVVPGLSTLGYKAIGVPGSVAGMVTAEKKWGKLGLQKVIAPAIRLARDGFPLPWEDVRSFQNKRLAEFPESRRIFQRDGNLIRLVAKHNFSLQGSQEAEKIYPLPMDSEELLAEAGYKQIRSVTDSPLLERIGRGLAASLFRRRCLD